MTHDLKSSVTRKPASGKVKQLVVLLHGYGADGANLIDLADFWSRHLPDALFTAPNAPHPCEAGGMGYQWFSLQDRNPARMLAGVSAASQLLDAYLDGLLREYALSNAQLALVGFSQGTMTALHCALRRAEPVACVVGFSGALIGPEMLLTQIKSRPPVCLVHGDADEVVPFAAMAAAQSALKAANVRVETHARPFVGHSIDLEGIDLADRFLRQGFGV